VYFPELTAECSIIVLLQILQQPPRGREKGTETVCHPAKARRIGQGHRQADASHTSGANKMRQREYASRLFGSLTVLDLGQN
jgi:hypothetical protein